MYHKLVIFLWFFEFICQTKQATVYTSLDSELAFKIENDSRKNRGVGLRLQAEKIILKWEVT